MNSVEAEWCMVVASWVMTILYSACMYVNYRCESSHPVSRAIWVVTAIGFGVAHIVLNSLHQYGDGASMTSIFLWLFACFYILPISFAVEFLCLCLFKLGAAFVNGCCDIENALCHLCVCDNDQCCC